MTSHREGGDCAERLDRNAVRSQPIVLYHQIAQKWSDSMADGENGLQKLSLPALCESAMMKTEQRKRGAGRHDH